MPPKKSSSDAGPGGAAPRKKAAPKDPESAEKPRKKAAPKDAAPKRDAAPKKSAGAKKKKGPVTGGPKPRRPSSIKRWLIAEVATWSAGAAVGLGVAGWFLWTQAREDVASYLADPPRTAPGVIWSAPMEIREGQRASIASIAGDLLAAGYDRVPSVPKDPPATEGAGLFSVADDRLEIVTTPWEAPGIDVPGSRVVVHIEDGRVTSLSDRDGAILRPTVLGTVGDLEDKRAEVSLKGLSRWVEPALLAIEDARFRAHRGIDPVGILRAIVVNVAQGRDVQGGSTLTQQLAKNLFLSPERTLRRKVREAFFAAALEAELDKDALLELYLGEVYLGQMGGLPLYGIEAASRAWFGKSAARLDAHEAATIVGVIAAPNRYSPVRHPEECVARRDRVLDRMVETGALDRSQADAAKQRPLTLAGLEPSRVRRAPYAVDHAVELAEKALGEGAMAGGGYQVFTTIQPLLQRAAEEAVGKGMAELDREYPKAAGAQVALVAVRVEDGAIVAMVGGRSYATSPFNRAIDAWRQAGSTVKPLTLLAALDAGKVTPSSRIADEPISRKIDGKMWTPSNYDGRFLGEITVRQAIEGSRNIPAILMAEDVGAGRLQRIYQRAGLDRATQLPSTALGGFPVTPTQLAGAFTAFPGGGVAREPRLLRSIATASDEEVLTFGPDLEKLADAKAAAQAVGILQGVIETGTGARADKYGVSGAVGGKTGTTDDYRDAWFVGFTPELAVAVWVGRDTGTLGLSGSRAALPTWARFVEASGTMDGQFERPKGMAAVALCAESGQVARPQCEHTVEQLFPEGDAPKGSCDLHGAPRVEVGRVLGGIFRRRGEHPPEEPLEPAAD